MSFDQFVSGGPSTQADVTSAYVVPTWTKWLDLACGTCGYRYLYPNCPKRCVRESCRGEIAPMLKWALAGLAEWEKAQAKK